ncbi:MAG: hypothetical protein LBT27_05865, partial [Prevotellaceae bacterium]|nr:hypothetical protein [Prevotellaceae bacterium]
KLGLTAQESITTLQVATNKAKKSVVRGNYQISFVIQPNIITNENIPILQLLDCLRFFKNIPTTLPNDSCKQLLLLFGQYTEKQIHTTKQLALKYNPATIAFLGALLETLNDKEDTNALYNLLNHQSSYKLGMSKNILLNQKKWHIR